MSQHEHGKRSEREVVRERVVHRGDGRRRGPWYGEVNEGMGIGVSIFLLAVGAILAWGVTITVQGIDLDMIGVILMIIGGIGLLFSLLFWSSWAPWGRDREVTREREVHDHDHHDH